MKTVMYGDPQRVKVLNIASDDGVDSICYWLSHFVIECVIW